MELTQKRILITGGSGFIGSHLCDALLRTNNLLTLLCLEDDPLSNLSEIKNRLNIIRCDLTDVPRLAEIVKDVAPQYVFHLAARVDRDRSVSLLREMTVNNLLPMASLIQVLAATDLRRFLVLGTSDIYGQAEAPCTEDTPLKPNSPYALSKSAVLLYARYAWQNYKIPTVMLVPFMIYGPRQNPRMMISQAIRAALNNEEFAMTRGEQVREFNYVEDVVQGLIRAAYADNVIGETINLCGGPRMSIYEATVRIYSMIGDPKKIRRGSLEYRENETMNHYGDNAKCRRLLGYEPQTTFEDALDKTIAYFKMKN